MLKPNDKPICADKAYNPEAWHPEALLRDPEGSRLSILNAVEALRLCMVCPVRQACLEYALADMSTTNYGIYGGTLAYERQAVTSFGKMETSKEFLQRIRSIATKAGIPTPKIGAKSSKGLRKTA
jgi:Transcription factor WhiB